MAAEISVLSFSAMVGNASITIVLFNVPVKVPKTNIKRNIIFLELVGLLY
jgi:hypothetical protein